jgi:DNA polymerase-3 subunit gamma/tau
VIALAVANRDIQLKTALERDVRLVRFEEGSIEFELAPGASPTLAATLMRKLGEWTGIRWMVAVTASGGAASLKERADAAMEAERQNAASDPLVRKVLDMFPGAAIVAVRAAEAEVPAPPAVIPDEPPVIGDEDVGYIDDAVTDDDL